MKVKVIRLSTNYRALKFVHWEASQEARVRPFDTSPRRKKRASDVLDASQIGHFVLYVLYV